MGQGRRNIVIHLKTTIDQDGEKEYTTIQANGHFFHKDGVDVLIYNELYDDEAVRNLVTIRPERTTIKRSGALAMNQQFYVNQKTETYYRHPYGRLHMETYTHAITYESITHRGRGRLIVDYTATLNQAEKRRHLLELTYYEEES